MYKIIGNINGDRFTLGYTTSLRSAVHHYKEIGWKLRDLSFIKQY